MDPETARTLLITAAFVFSLIAVAGVLFFAILLYRQKPRQIRIVQMRARPLIVIEIDYAKLRKSLPDNPIDAARWIEMTAKAVKEAYAKLQPGEPLVFNGQVIKVKQRYVADDSAVESMTIVSRNVPEVENV